MLIPLDEAKKLTLEDAIKIAMVYTKETNNEVRFQYDPHTKQVLTSITAGDKNYVQGLKSESVIPLKASFHTHTHSRSKKCKFSDFDLQEEFARVGTEEIKLGCPEQNEILTLRIESMGIKKVLYHLYQPGNKYFYLFKKMLKCTIV